MKLDLTTQKRVKKPETINNKNNYSNNNNRLILEIFLKIKVLENTQSAQNPKIKLFLSCRLMKTNKNLNNS